MQYNAMIFDLDGTLLNTLDDLGDAANRVLAGRGFPVHGMDVYRVLIGNGAARLIKSVLPEDKRDEATVNACLIEYLEDYDKNWNVKTRPYEGILETLKELSGKGVKMAILSNKPDLPAKQCVRELLPNPSFDIVLGQRDGFPLKPDPSGALEIARQLKIPPQEFIFLGDSAVDMKTALSAGMYPVGALWGFKTKNELIEAGAKLVINKPQDILRFFN